MAERIAEVWAHVCLTYRKSVLMLIVAVTALAATALPGARFDNALEIWFVEDDPALVAHRELIDTFTSDELIVVGLEAHDVFSPDVLAVIDRVTLAMAEAPHVEKVFSLTNIESVTGNDDSLEIGDLIEMPVDPATLPAVRRKALANELYVGNVVSEDGDFTCIVARLPHYRDDFDYKIEAIDAVSEILARETGTRFYLSGGPALDAQFFYLSERDAAVTTPAMVALLVITLWLLLRSVSAVMLALATVTISTMWGVAWIVLAGVRVNMLTTLLPPLLLAVGVAGSMHVLVDYRRKIDAGHTREEALARVYRELMTPLFLTSFTTAIGMLSLLVSRIPGIREFGFFAALGVAGAFVLSLTVVPIVLSYLPAPTRRTSGARSGGSVISDAALERLHRLTVTRGRAIVVVSLVLLGAAVVGGFQVRAESAFLEYFGPEETIRLDTERIEDALAGTISIDVIVDTGRPDGIKDPAVLAAMEDLQGFLESNEHITSTQSVADYLKDLRRAFFSNDQDEYRLPETASEAAQYLLLYEMDAPDGDIYEMVTFDYSKARVTARVDIESSSIATQIIADTEEYLARNFPEGLDARITGMGTLYAHMEEYLRDSLVLGFSIALVAIFVVFCLLMRSVVVGAILMIPNVAPIVLCLGVMGLLDIRLDSMTAMVASIAIGLAVDDSIHFVSRARQYLEAGRPMDESLRLTTVEIGRALIFTSVALSAGFGVMMLSAFVGTVNFGLLCLLTILFALAADLVLLPVVLRWWSGAAEEVPAQAPAAGSVLAHNRAAPRTPLESP